MGLILRDSTEQLKLPRNSRFATSTEIGLSAVSPLSLPLSERKRSHSSNKYLSGHWLGDVFQMTVLICLLSVLFAARLRAAPSPLCYPACEIAVSAIN